MVPSLANEGFRPAEPLERAVARFAAAISRCVRSEATVTVREPLRDPLGGRLAATVNVDFAVAPG